MTDQMRFSEASWSKIRPSPDERFDEFPWSGLACVGLGGGIGGALRFGRFLAVSSADVKAASKAVFFATMSLWHEFNKDLKKCVPVDFLQ